jgi:hypothetical protein
VTEINSIGGKFLRFAVTASVESEVSVGVIFPTYLVLFDGSDSGCFTWEFYVRIDLVGNNQARVDLLKVDSDGGYEFSTDIRPLRRTGEFFRPGNSYDKSSPAEFNAKIAELRAVIDEIPRE